LSLRNLSHKQVIKVLTKYFGFVPVRQSGSHIILENPTNQRFCVLPRHDVIKLGTIRAILFDAGISEEDFIKHL
jgi:predicted RNA binding protein YcfA (HicA-like mRNA interferase family)